MTDKGNSHADRLEQALEKLEANKKAAASMAAGIEPELERLAALNKKLEALPQSERRQVRDAMGQKHVSAAPKPLKPLRGSSYTPPSRPPELLAMEMPKAATNLIPEPQAAPLTDELKTLTDRELLAAFSETVNNGAPLNWRYWVSQLPTLTTPEAARLMCGLDPDLFKSLESRPNKNDQSNPCKKAAMIQRLAEREGKESATPSEWISWAGEHQIAVHEGFRLEIESEQARTAATPAPVVPTEPQATTPSRAPVVAETVEQRRARYLAMFEAEEKREKRGALQRAADSEGIDRSNMRKDIDKALAARDKQKRAGFFVSQLVQDGKRMG